MKAEELMIGDWVYNTHNRQPEQMAEIGSGLVMLAYNDLYEYDEIEPIPLTAEILEANGFEKNSAKYYRIVIGKQMAGDGYEIQEVAISETGLLLIFTSVCDVRIPIKYVHQLQHALRLCDIDKEITL